jgi:hypothetical protein
MNRTSELFDDRIAEWLEDDPVEAPPQLLETVLAAAPSIQQRRSGVAWPRRPMSLPIQLAAALAVIAVASVLGLLVLRGPLVGPPPSPPSPPGLPTRIDVPLRFYSIDLPGAWTTAVSPGAAGRDTYDGPEGRLDVRFVLIPRGTGQDEWADAYFLGEMQGSDGCPGIDAGTWDPARVGSSDGRLYSLPCQPGWMALTAIGDRAYDVRFKVRGGADQATAHAVFVQILDGITIDAGSTPPLALSPFTSRRYGYAISYPSAWKVTEAVRDLRQFDVPWWSGSEQIDAFTGPGTGTSPGQPAEGELGIAAAALPSETSLQDFTNATAGLTCGHATGTPVSVDGESGSLAEYANCQGYFQLWLTVLHDGRGYHILWLDAPANAGYDRAIFQQVLSTFRFNGAIGTASPERSTASPPPTP